MEKRQAHNTSKLARFTKFHPAAVWSSISLGLLSVWASLTGYGSAFLPTAENPLAAPQADLGRPAFYFGLILCGVFLLVLSKRIPPIKIYLDCAIVVMMCLGTAGFSIAWKQDLFNPAILSAFGCAFCGFGYAWFVRSFYLLLAERESMYSTIIAIAVGLLVGELASMALGVSLKPAAQVIVCTTIPPVACLALIILANRTAPPQPMESKLENSEERYHLVILLLALISLFVTQAITGFGLWGHTREAATGFSLNTVLVALGSCLVFAAAAWLVLLRHSETPLHVRYQIPLITLITSCMLFLVSTWVLTGLETIADDIIGNAVEMFAQLVLWAVVVSAIKTLRFNGYQILGATAVIYGILAEVWILTFEKMDDLVPVLILMVVYIVALILGAFPTLLRGSQPKLEESVTLDSDSVHLVAKRYALTPRETEVFTYLAKGHSRPYIQQKLYLSDGTVKTHTSHIYTKLNVHTRQDLLDLIEMQVLEAASADLEERNLT
ncbi:MAG: LuxR C-terminal-related transcriptional regulator [Eggerthellaceae bacterium]|nr:LuxR C-terminal-related transcriptional regulator [Eggerthellaceae bacterium]